MSYPRKKLDLSLLILENRSCQAMIEAAKEKNPNWDFDRFEAIYFSTYEGIEKQDRQYDAYQVMSQAEERFDKLDAECPISLPMEEGTHYLWELFVEQPHVDVSPSARQLWQRLARALSDKPLPMDEEAFSKYFEEALWGLLCNATDMGDRFYLSNLDFGGWNGGIVSKDYLVDGMQLLMNKLQAPYYRKKKEEEERVCK